MKKILCIAMVLTALNTHAQKIQIGFTTGLAISNYHATYDGNTESADPKVGITAGLLADIPAGRHFSFQPAINFVQKGTQEEYTFNNITAKVKLNINLLEFPFNFLYNSRGRHGNFFIGAGPSLAVAIGGKMKVTNGSTSMSENIKFGNGDDDLMKGFDMGANFTTGFSLNNGLLFSVNYNAGLNNLAPGSSADNGSLRSSYLGIKLGFLLGRKSRK